MAQKTKRRTSLKKHLAGHRNGHKSHRPMMTKRISKANPLYLMPINEVKSHPYISLGTLTLGAGLLSALIIFKRNH